MRWPAQLVDAVTHHARAGAVALSEQLLDGRALPGPVFVPLAELVPILESRS